MNEQMRAEFEQDFTERYTAHKLGRMVTMGGDLGDEYKDPRVQYCWVMWQAAHARYAMPECHSVIDGKRTEDMTEKELRYHLQESSRIMQQQADEIAELRARYAGSGEAVLEIPNDTAHLIFFEDNDRKPEVFIGHGAREAARRRYEQISQNWNAHLFVCIDHNCKQDKSSVAKIVGYAGSGEAAQCSGDGEIECPVCNFGFEIALPAQPKVPDYVLDALENLTHDNYETSFSGYKNRQADIELLRCALTNQAQPKVPEGHVPVPIKTIREAMSCVYSLNAKLYDELQAMLTQATKESDK